MGIQDLRNSLSVLGVIYQPNSLHLFTLYLHHGPVPLG
jgi:hypothetical protein